MKLRGWIKMRTALLTHPKIVRMASALKADRLRVIGGLYAVWCLFDSHSEDGILTGYALESLDDYLGWHGFSAAMVEVEWLHLDGGNLVIPRYAEHNGQPAKRRAQESKRKKNVRNVSAQNADKCKPAREKNIINLGLLSASIAFRMHVDWKPSYHFPILAKQAGMVVTDADIAVFKAHWLDQDGLRTQAEWDRELIASLGSGQ